MVRNWFWWWVRSWNWEVGEQIKPRGENGGYGLKPVRLLGLASLEAFRSSMSVSAHISSSVKTPPLAAWHVVLWSMTSVKLFHRCEPSLLQQQSLPPYVGVGEESLRLHEEVRITALSGKLVQTFLSPSTLYPLFFSLALGCPQHFTCAFMVAAALAWPLACAQYSVDVCWVKTWRQAAKDR